MKEAISCVLRTLLPLQRRYDFRTISLVENSTGVHGILNLTDNDYIVGAETLLAKVRTSRENELSKYVTFSAIATL